MKELNIAIRAAKKAGKYLLKQYNSDEDIKFDKKGVLELVTKHDKASEKMIMNILNKNLDYNIVTEESGAINRKSDFTWIIDPIDGTTNFTRKFPYFAISIGLAKKDKIVAGAVYNPAHDELFFAEKGKGAFLNEKKLKVSRTSKIGDSVIANGFCYATGKNLENDLKIFGRVKHNVNSVRRAGAAALDMCNVAAGRFDGYYEIGIKIWDVAAGKIILEEAGGKVSTRFGKELKIEVNSICATNGKLHQDLLRLIK